MVDNTCPWIRLNGLTAAQGYRIDGAVAGEGLGSALAAIGDQNGDGRPDLAIGASAASPNGRESAGEIVVMPGQAGSATQTTASALQRFQGPAAGAGLGASVAAAGDVNGDGRGDLLAGAPGEASSAGAAYFLLGAAGTVADLAQGGFISRVAPVPAGAQTGSAVAAGPGNALVAAPGGNGGAGAVFSVDGSGWPAPPPVPPTPPASPAPPPPPPAAKPPAKKPREAQALPGQEAQAEVQDRQGQARQDQARALPPAPEAEVEARDERARWPGPHRQVARPARTRP